MKLSHQEKLVLNYLDQHQEVCWEELSQFSKNPNTVKLKTIQRIVSDIKKKFKDNNSPIPFNCTFKSLVKQQPNNKVVETTEFLGQQLVRVEKRNNVAIHQVESTINNELKTDSKTKMPAFNLKPYTKQVITHSGTHTLNAEEYELFDYMLTNHGRFIALEELRDKVCYPKFGSKTPARWFSAIQRRISNIRHQIPESRNKLLTARQDSNTGYIFN